MDNLHLQWLIPGLKHCHFHPQQLIQNLHCIYQLASLEPDTRYELKCWVVILCYQITSDLKALRKTCVHGPLLLLSSWKVLMMIMMMMMMMMMMIIIIIIIIIILQSLQTF